MKFVVQLVHFGALLLPACQAVDIEKTQKGTKAFLDPASPPHRTVAGSAPGNEKPKVSASSSNCSRAEVETSGITAVQRNATWADWKVRFPQLHFSGSQTERWAQVWAGLGSNWWLSFIDGKAHAYGPHVWDAPFTDYESWSEGVQSGTGTFEYIQKEVDRFNVASAWDEPWTPASLAALNARFQELSCTTADCLDMYYGWLPRDQHTWKVDNINHTMSPFTCNECPGQCTKQRKEKALGRILRQYHDSVSSLKRAGSDNGGSQHLIESLPHLALLYAKLADLHPFNDGNSRVRMLLLQTELVRLGGHPLVMWDVYWAVYWARSLEDVVNMMLNGWCSWEVALRTKRSPFMLTDSANVSTAMADYDADSGGCVRRLAPSNPDVWTPFCKGAHCKR